MITPNENQLQPTPFLIWNTFDILLNQARYLLEEGEAADEQAGFKMACEDNDLILFEWAFLLDSLTEQLNIMNPKGFWSGEVVNFGWNKRSGFTTFHAENGHDFLAHILPKTDCTFRLYVESGNTIRIQNYHHDSPTGNEWYTLTPLTTEQCEAA